MKRESFSILYYKFKMNINLKFTSYLRLFLFFQIHKILGLILLTPVVLAQMDADKPDISYSGNNDRFDLTSMMRANNKMNRDTPLIDDDEEAASDAEYRRNIGKEDTGTLKDGLQSKQDPNPILTRRDDEGFAVDDRFNSYEGGSESQFEENLKKFTANTSSKSTANADEEVTESEVPLQNDTSTVVDVVKQPSE